MAKKVNPKQLSLLDFEKENNGKSVSASEASPKPGVSPSEARKNEEDLEETASEEKKEERLPATSLMKTVARRAPGNRSMLTSFSENELEEMFGGRTQEEDAEEKERRERIKKQKAAEKREYFRIKGWVKEKEKGNRRKLYAFPAKVGEEDWYKMMNFSALYYTYRLADRMGRSSRILTDTDKSAQAFQIASLRYIEKFAEQFKLLEDGKVEKTLDGVYIFTLKKPLSDDELLALRRTEETRREQLHNILRPKMADPAIHSLILMLMRQTAPRVRKLERVYCVTVGETLLGAIVKLLSVYQSFSEKLYTKEEAKRRLLLAINEITGALTLLAETRVWGYDAVIMIGQNITEIKRLLMLNLSEENKK